MFSKTIIDSDVFLDMPLSAQALYFHLSMRADDDGFVNNPKKIQRMVGASEEDYKTLITKQYILVYDSGIIVIKHWKIHNYIRNDRYKPTPYTVEKSALIINPNGEYTLMDTNGIPNDNHLDTQDRLGKDRLELGKDRLDYEHIKDMYNETCVSFPRLTVLSDKRKQAIKARLNSGYKIEDFKKLFTEAESSSFLKGKNSQDWQANFDWLIKDANMAKVLDGNYRDKGKKMTDEKFELKGVTVY